ncbi:SUKH-4 family immunity protein [Streptomyces albidoflavus]
MATYDQLTSWAGPGGVTRLRREDVAGWRIPDAMKVHLVETGIPVAPRLTDQADPDTPAERSSFGVAPETGTVHFVLPDGETRFANSGIGPRLDTLHRYGTHVTTSALLGEPDGPEEYLSPAEEEQALAELGRLSEELRETDPAAFAGYAGFLWPELLDRWRF